MTTLVPEHVAPVSEPEAGRRVAGPGWAARASGWLKGDSNSRMWLRRKAVAAWMNILIVGAAGVTVATAGIMAGRPWPQPGTWGVSVLKLFTLDMQNLTTMNLVDVILHTRVPPGRAAGSLR